MELPSARSSSFCAKSDGALPFVRGRYSGTPVKRKCHAGAHGTFGLRAECGGLGGHTSARADTALLILKTSDPSQSSACQVSRTPGLPNRLLHCLQPSPSRPLSARRLSPDGYRIGVSARRFISATCALSNRPPAPASGSSSTRTSPSKARRAAS